MKNFMVINGPSLNMLGVRETNVYGQQTLDEINSLILADVSRMEVELEFVQTNHEGDIIDELHAAYYDGVDGIVLNAGAYTHYSYAIRDAIASVSIPVVEVHLSDINSREPFRKVSVIKDVCVSQISGMGYEGYVKAVELLDEVATGESYD